jgi:hypothetical protein
MCTSSSSLFPSLHLSSLHLFFFPISTRGEGGVVTQ